MLLCELEGVELKEQGGQDKPHTPMHERVPHLRGLSTSMADRTPAVKHPVAQAEGDLQDLPTQRPLGPLLSI